MKVKSSLAMHSACDRQIFASGPAPSGLVDGASREKAVVRRLGAEVSVLCSAACCRVKITEIGHKFARIFVAQGRNSLQSRLSGGAGLIRTFGTGFEPPKSEVS